MRETILGAGGVIANTLAKMLAKEQSTVRLVSRHPQAVVGDEELICADLLDAASVRDAVKDSDIVYLTVGLKYSTKVWQTSWPVIMQNVIDACQKHQAKLVFFDNVYMYGLVEGAMSEETPYNPCSKKGKVRAQIAKMLEDAMRDGRIQALIARSADFYGEGADNSFAMPMIFDKYKAGKSATWLLDKTKPHSMTYTVDAAKALVMLAHDESAYKQIWHLPTAKPALTGEAFMREVAKAYGAPEKQNTISALMLTVVGWFVPIIRETKEMRYQFTHPYIFDSSKFQKRYFKATPYKEAILEIVT